MPKTKLAVPISLSLFFLWVSFHLIYERQGDLIAAHPNVWGDWAAHFTYTMHFAERSPSDWFTKNPIFAGGKLHYPFLINFFASLLVRVGVDLSLAVRLTSAVTILGAVWLLHRFFKHTVGFASAALLIVFLGGNLGWVLYLRDLFTGGNFWDKLFFPPLEYGHLNDWGLSVGGTLSCLWFPQRGLPLAVVTSIPLLLALTSETPLSRRKQIGAGMLAGLLPIIHVHTLVCVSAFAACFIVDKRKTSRPYWPALVSFLVTSGLLWILYHHDSPGGSFLTWQPGWLAANPGTPANRMGWILFWIWNWSIFLPLVVTSFFWVRPLQACVPIITGVFLFVVANLVRFQPWDWDNTKIFFWSYLFMTPAVIQVLSKLATLRWGKTITRIAFVLLIATGALETLRFFSPSRTSHVFFDRREREWANKLIATVPANAVVLSSGDAHDWVGALAGRQVIMGYSGWLWSYGLPGMEREQEVKNFFQALPGGKDLLSKYGVTHIVVDRKTRANYAVNEKSLLGIPVLWNEGDLTVYVVNPTPVEPPR